MLDINRTEGETTPSIKSRFDGTNLPSRARWSASADAALRQPSGLNPPTWRGFFLVCIFAVDPRMTIDKSLDDTNACLKSIRQQREELERRMDYVAQPLSEDQRDQLNADFHNAVRMLGSPYSTATDILNG